MPNLLCRVRRALGFHLGTQGQRAHETPDQRDALAGVPPATMRVLMVDVQLPRPDRDSGSLRAFTLLSMLRELGCAVDFLPDRDNGPDDYHERLRQIDVRVMARHSPGSLLRASNQGTRYDAIIICRYFLAEYWMPFLRHCFPSARIILDTVDLHHLREMREAELRSNPRQRRLAGGTRRRELGVIARCDETWVVSPDEKKMLVGMQPGASIAVIPNLHADIAAHPPAFEEREGMLFIGGAAHPPNVDAVLWLLKNILPLVHARAPRMKLHLVGTGLSSILPPCLPANVVCHDYVPDLVPLLNSVRIGVAPLRFGAGVKGKVSQCMAHGLPMVLTPCAAEGMHLANDVNAMIASSVEAFADHIVQLHEDRELWNRLSQRGRALVESHFSPAAVMPALRASLANS